MASAKLAPILEDLIGSVDGNTFSHTKACLIVKAKSYPGSAHPFTPSQSQLDIRNLFSVPAAHWKTLQPQTITDWCDLAKTIPAYNKFGESYYQAGFNLYCQVQQNMQLIGNSIYDAAPLFTPPIPIYSFIIFFVGGAPDNILIDFTGYTTSVKTTSLIYATPPTSAGRFYVKNYYRLIGLLPPNTQDTFDITSLYSAKFPLPTDNKRVSIKLIQIENSTGFAATPIYATNVFHL
jgi:hypothetical protein